MTSSPINSSNEETDAKKTLNFSIEHILNKAGSNNQQSTSTSDCLIRSGSLSYVPFPWLHCTRYCPPKIPRNQRKDVPQKRQLGRHPRIPFTTYQLTILEEKFKQTPYLSSQEVKEISRKLDLADIRVKIWFQNRRARERREKSFPKEESSDNESTITTSQSNTNISILPNVNTNIQRINCTSRNMFNATEAQYQLQIETNNEQFFSLYQRTDP